MENDLIITKQNTALTLRKANKLRAITYKLLNQNNTLSISEKQASRLTPPIDLDAYVWSENLYKMANFP